ncbi:hypothetical protein QUA70_07260 [Microcoleus sp. LAD1_D5]
MSFASLATNQIPIAQNRTQPLPSSPSPLTDEFFVKKDDRTVVSYQRH